MVQTCIMRTLESTHDGTTNSQKRTCSQARIYGVQQDVGKRTTRINQVHPWMGPIYQKTHSDTPGQQLQRLIKRHHEYAWKRGVREK